ALAEGEAVLEQVAEYVAGAEAPLETQTRTEYNLVSGITGAIEDNRITSVILSRDTRRGLGRRVFGGTIDQLLDRTTAAVLVTAFDEPVNTAERIVVLLPGQVAANPGFLEGVHTVKRLGKQLGVPVVGLLVRGDVERYRELIDLVEPETTFELESISTWNHLYRDEARIQETDLVVVLSPRPETRGWVSPLDSAPSRLRRAGARNVVTVYLAEERTLSTRRLRVR
ncbi:MAG: cation:proton antiporter, partial [Halobacteriales archaeon]